MDRIEQKKDEQSQVISPLANEKTYGERMYSRVFGWGLNYWTNLLASAGFSQWAEHSVKPFKLPFIMKDAASPRDLQQGLAATVRKHDPFFQRFEKKTLTEMAGKAASDVIHNRSMARARSLTLLMPGFLVMIPSVWLGAKIKPKFVEFFNKRHYGADAMDDPSLVARQQAIEAEDRPTFLGTVIGRLGTVFAVQFAAQTFGSDHNLIQKYTPAKNFKGIDHFTESLGTSLGGSFPAKFRNGFDTRARKWGFDWSLAQHTNAAELGLNMSAPYAHATQDLGRFIVADTVYTAISAGTIYPIMKYLQRAPLVGPMFAKVMSYKSKHAPNSPTLDGDKIKVPSNRYADEAPVAALSRAVEEVKPAETIEEKPRAKVSNIRDRSALSQQPQHHLA